MPLSGDGTGQDRAQLRAVFERLAAAGWHIRDGRMQQDATGLPLAFEILLVQPEQERFALHWVRTLKRLGIEASVRTVDSAQYQGRLETFDFDVVVNLWANSCRPATSSPSTGDRRPQHRRAAATIRASPRRPSMPPSPPWSRAAPATS